MVAVVVCICTCQRPEGLRHLLESLEALDWQGDLQIVVVDNDQGEAGIRVCRAIESSCRWPLHCGVEPERGISFARNRAISLALQLNPDFIAMLDDDEWPSSAWLNHLMSVQKETGADVVGGPVIPSFPPAADTWVEQAMGCYGANPEIEDASACNLYASGNFIARANCFRALMPNCFRREFALTGGEDYVFFRSLLEQGYTSYWSRQALVWETVPESRLHLDWVRRHMILKGNIQVRMYRAFEPGVLAEVLRWSKTCGLLGYGLLEYLLTLPRDQDRLKALLILWRAQGKLMAHLGHTLTRPKDIEGV